MSGAELDATEQWAANLEQRLDAVASDGERDAKAAKVLELCNEDNRDFDAIDKAWASLDLETVKSYISEDAVMKFADGKVAVGGDEFVEMIQQEVEQWGEAEYVWTTDYKFSLATTSDNDDSTNVDQGDWVNAQFTQELETPVDGNKRNVYYEFYHIIDGKVVSWSQFKRGEKE